eukprot:TRINITY_DN21607_c0_g1_i2.p1 TRINITY_DN21607_c0_g1~~TRINITY_DN21607_c0_g1_i2.p1  ORF type:complete len:1098 (+),score=164.24 TRINITY_DN21607_c0_g1_i2:215-3295(+)
MGDDGGEGGESVRQESEKQRCSKHPEENQGDSGGGVNNGEQTRESDSPLDLRSRGFCKGWQKGGGAKGVKVVANVIGKRGVKVIPWKTDRKDPKVTSISVVQLRSPLQQRSITLNGPRPALMKRLSDATTSDEGRDDCVGPTDVREDLKLSVESGDAASATSAALKALGALTKSPSMAGSLHSSSAPSSPCGRPPPRLKRTQDDEGSDDKPKSSGSSRCQSLGPSPKFQGRPPPAPGIDVDGSRSPQSGGRLTAVTSLPISPKASRTKRSCVVPPARPPGVLHKDQEVPVPRPTVAGGPCPHTPSHGDVGASRHVGGATVDQPEGPPVQSRPPGPPGPPGLADSTGLACALWTPEGGSSGSLPPPRSTSQSSQPPPGDWAHQDSRGEWRVPEQPMTAQHATEPPGEWPAHGPWPVRQHSPVVPASGTVVPPHPAHWRPCGPPPLGQYSPKGSPQGSSGPMSLAGSSDWRHQGCNAGPPSLEWKQPQSHPHPQAPAVPMSSAGQHSQPLSAWGASHPPVGAPPQQSLASRGPPPTGWRLPSSLHPPAGYGPPLGYGLESLPLGQQAPAVPSVGGCSRESAGDTRGYDWKPPNRGADPEVGSAWGEAISSAPARALGNIVNSKAPSTEDLAARLAALGMNAAADVAGGGETAIGVAALKGGRRRHRQRRREHDGNRPVSVAEGDSTRKRHRSGRHGRMKFHHRASSAPTRKPADIRGSAARLAPTSSPASAVAPPSTLQQTAISPSAASQSATVQLAATPLGGAAVSIGSVAEDSLLPPATAASHIAPAEEASVSTAVAAVVSAVGGGRGCGCGVSGPPLPEDSVAQHPRKAAVASVTKGSPKRVHKPPTTQVRIVSSSSSNSEDDEADAPPSTELLTARLAALTPKRRQIEMDGRAAAAAAAVAGPARAAATVAATSSVNSANSGTASTVNSAQSRRHEVGRQVLGRQDSNRQDGRRHEFGRPQPGSPQEADAAAGRQEGGTASFKRATGDGAAGAPSSPKAVGAASPSRTQDIAEAETPIARDSSR